MTLVFINIVLGPGKWSSLRDVIINVDHWNDNEWELNHLLFADDTVVVAD